MWNHTSGFWYADVTYKGTKKVFSLRSKDEREARRYYNDHKDSKRKKLIEEYNDPSLKKKSKYLTFKQFYPLFLNDQKSNWKKGDKGSTYANYRIALERYHKYGNAMFDNISTCSKHTYSSHINTALRWAYDKKYTSNLALLNKGEKTYRSRVYSNAEMELILNNHHDKEFQDFIKLAYFTGARVGEIVKLKHYDIHKDFIRVGGKTTGGRLLKINDQAKPLIHNREVLWNYTENSVGQRWRRYTKKLRIENGSFHDIRRTFGLNLILNGVPIYEVSHLLGHKDVRTTQKSYAPFLVTMVKEFRLPVNALEY